VGIELGRVMVRAQFGLSQNSPKPLVSHLLMTLESTGLVPYTTHSL